MTFLILFCRIIAFISKILLIIYTRRNRPIACYIKHVEENWFVKFNFTMNEIILWHNIPSKWAKVALNNVIHLMQHSSAFSELTILFNLHFLYAYSNISLKNSQFPETRNAASYFRSRQCFRSRSNRTLRTGVDSIAGLQCALPFLAKGTTSAATECNEILSLISVIAWLFQLHVPGS